MNKIQKLGAFRKVVESVCLIWLLFVDWRIAVCWLFLSAEFWNGIAGGILKKEYEKNAKDALRMRKQWKDNFRNN